MLQQEGHAEFEEEELVTLLYNVHFAILTLFVLETFHFTVLQFHLRFNMASLLELH